MFFKIMIIACFCFFSLFAATDQDECIFATNPTIENLEKILPYLDHVEDNSQGVKEWEKWLNEILKIVKLYNDNDKNLESKLAMGLYGIYSILSKVENRIVGENSFFQPDVLIKRSILKIIDDFKISDSQYQQEVTKSINKLISMGFLGTNPSRIGLINFSYDTGLTQSRATNFLNSNESYQVFYDSLSEKNNQEIELYKWESIKRRISTILYNYNIAFSKPFSMNAGQAYQINKLPYQDWASFMPFGLERNGESVRLNSDQNRKKYFFEMIVRVNAFIKNIKALNSNDIIFPGVILISESRDYFKPLPMARLTDLMTNNKRLDFNIPEDFKILDGQLSFYEWALSMSQGIMPIGSKNIRLHDLAHLAEFYMHPHRSMKPTRNFYHAIFNTWYKIDADNHKIAQLPLALKILKKMGLYTNESITNLNSVSLTDLQVAVKKLELIPDLFNESLKTNVIDFSKDMYPYLTQKAASGDLGNNIALLVPVFNEISSNLSISSFVSLLDGLNNDAPNLRERIKLMIKLLFNHNMPIHVLGGDSNDGYNATRQIVKDYNFPFIRQSNMTAEQYKKHVNRFPDVAYFNLTDLARKSDQEIEEILSNESNKKKVITALSRMGKIINAAKNKVSGPQDFIFNLYAEKLDENNPSLKYLSEGYDIEIRKLVEYFSSIELWD